MFFRSHSLTGRIVFPFAVISALSMAVLSVFLTFYFRDSYLNISKENLKSEASLIADQVSPLIQGQPAGITIDEMARRYASLLKVRVTIIDKSGKVLGESDTVAAEMGNHLDRPEIARALQGITNTETRFSATLNRDMLYAAAPILNGNLTVGVARVAISLDDIQNNLNRIQKTVLIAGVSALILALALSTFIAFLTVSPIKQLTDVVKNLASGEAAGLLPSPRRDEIGQLQNAFQTMAQQLQSQIGELQTERGKLEAVLSNMTDGIFIIDAEGVVQLMNPAACRIFNLEEPTIGKTLIEVVRNHQIVELWRKSRKSGIQEIITLETAPDRLFVQGIATPLEPSQPGQTLLLLQDLTRIRRLETVRRDFVSNVSHELRTPLASLKALTETLQEGALDDPPAAQRFLQRMDTEIDNLTQMVHELLELSRIESNRVPLHLQPISLCDLLTPPIDRMMTQAERAGLLLSLDCPSDLPIIRADPERMAQVVINLIHNAIKFTPPGGRITVSAAYQGDSVIIAVRDTGVGIAPDALLRIFERFYKADRSRSGGGTGLGLSIARHMVEAHGGRIWAESAPNQGSAFFFSLPVHS